MKRDLNLIRGILLDIENAPAGETVHGFEFEGKSAPEIAEHVNLLLDTGFIEGTVARNSMGIAAHFVVIRLTWPGHEFLAKARNATIWKKVMSQAEEKGVSTSIVIISGLLEAAAKKYVGLE